jgi:hypothetical protein
MDNAVFKNYILLWVTKDLASDLTSAGDKKNSAYEVQLNHFWMAKKEPTRRHWNL